MSNLMNVTEVLTELRISRATLQRMRECGDFIEPLVIGKRKLAWRRDDVAAWIAAR